MSIILNKEQVEFIISSLIVKYQDKSIYTNLKVLEKLFEILNNKHQSNIDIIQNRFEKLFSLIYEKITDDKEDIQALDRLKYTYQQKENLLKRNKYLKVDIEEVLRKKEVERLLKEIICFTPDEEIKLKLIEALEKGEY